MFIVGMKCPLCGEPINSEDERVGFSSFVANEADPLHIFSDATFHRACFLKHPLSDKARSRYNVALESAQPANRICYVSGSLITNSEDYLTSGHLTDDQTNPLLRYNFAHFSRSALAGWKGLSSFIHQLEAFERSDEWKGKALGWFIGELKKYQK